MISQTQPHFYLFGVFNPLLCAPGAITCSRGFYVFVIAALVYSLPFFGMLFTPAIVKGPDLLPILFTVLAGIAFDPFFILRILLPRFVALTRLPLYFGSLCVLLMFGRCARPTPRGNAELTRLLRSEGAQQFLLRTRRATLQRSISLLLDWWATLSASVFERSSSRGVTPLTALRARTLFATCRKLARRAVAFVELSVREITRTPVTVFNGSVILKVSHVANASIIRDVVRLARRATVVRAVSILAERWPNHAA